MNFSELDLIARYPFRGSEHLLVDVGAHQGTVSLCFARLGWQIVAFEPEEKNRAAFERHLGEFADVTCLPLAVSDRSGEKVPFFVSDEHFGIHSLKPFHETHRKAYDVETVRLDDVLQRMEVEKVSLLKVDTEGADFLSLKGFDFTRYRPELVMIEFMDERSRPNFGYDHHDVVRYMADRGYEAFVSEWNPIKEYGREGVNTEPHTWLQCAPYPLDHEPSWGNLIFFPEENRTRFVETLGGYITALERAGCKTLGDRLENIPVVGALFRGLMRLR